MNEKVLYELIKADIEAVFRKYNIANYFCLFHKDNWLLDTIYFIFDSKDAKFSELSSLLHGSTELFIDCEDTEDIHQ